MGEAQGKEGKGPPGGPAPYVGGRQRLELAGEEKLAVLQLVPLLLRHGGLLRLLLEFSW